MKYFSIALLLLINVARAEVLGTSVSGKVVEINREHRTHLVFFDIWKDGYAEPGVWQQLKALPEAYWRSTRIVWIQPRINITDTQIKSFIDKHETYTPIVVDEDFSMMRQYQVWKTPIHVVLEDGSPIFSGGIKQLNEFVTNRE